MLFTDLLLDLEIQLCFKCTPSWHMKNQHTMIHVPSDSGKRCIWPVRQNIKFSYIWSYYLFLYSKLCMKTSTLINLIHVLSYVSWFYSYAKIVRDSLPLYPLFISAVCGLGSERFGSWKSEKSTTPPGIVHQKDRATIKPLHSVPAAWNSIKEIFIYSIIPITPQNNMCNLR